MGLALFGPLAVQVAPYIIKFVEDGIKTLHSTVPPSPENNKAKLATMAGSTISMLQGLVATGVLKPLPADQAELAGMATSLVQGIFNNLDANSQLPTRPGEPAKPAASDQPVPAAVKIESSGGLQIPISITGTIRLF